MADGPLDFETLSSLLAQEGEWNELPVGALSQLLILGVLQLNESPDGPRAMRRLYQTCLHRLSVEQRQQALLRLGSMVEGANRQASAETDFTSAFLPFMYLDSDPRISATAALQTAVLAPAVDGDPLTGVKRVLGAAMDTPDMQNRGRWIGALVALGDQRVTTLLDGVWTELDDAGKSACVDASMTPLAATIEFHVRWLEVAAATDEDDLGAPTAALVRLAQAAEQLGVTATTRTFPASAAAEDACVTVLGRWTREDYGASLRARLLDAAAQEHYPRLIPSALRAWGVEDEAFRDAVATALHAGGVASVARPIALEVASLPSWDAPSVVTEWGHFNPNGPTRQQLHVAPVLPGGAAAVVHVQHHPFCPTGVVIGVLGRDTPADHLGALVVEWAAANGTADLPICGCLPHYVIVNQEIVPNALAAEVFRMAHGVAVRDGHARDAPAERIDETRAIAADPWGESKRQMDQAFAEAEAAMASGRGLQLSQASPATAAEYAAWFDVVTSPAVVTPILDQMGNAWTVAHQLLRARSQGAE